MCRPCCEYHLIQCVCPSQRTQVGYTVPCCRNALDQCDPCIFHPGCSLFENCKVCHNGTWQANDDFFVRGTFCTECRQGWSGGDCRTCGGVIQRSQGHVSLETYPTNARCEWRVHAQRGHSIELRFSMLSLEADYNCRYDYVEVRDGDSLSSPVIGRFCGDQLPPPVKSSTNMLHILFSSDGYNNFDGFVLTFQEISGCSPSPCLHHGTCFLDPLHSFRCVCAVGFSGQRCEKDAAKNQVCELPEKPVNGYLLPVSRQGKEVVSVRYLCHPPYTLTGTQQRICLSNSTWSGTVPTCVKDKVIRTSQVRRGQCASPPKVPNGSFKPVPDMTGDADKIEFFCKHSYILSGNHHSTCLSNGSWSSRPPRCVRACREPRVSALVKQRVVKPSSSGGGPDRRLRPSPGHKVYDLSTPSFNTFTSDHQPEREDNILEELPRGFHQLYTNIEYECASPLYRHNGSSRRTCLQTGKWSGRHVSCSPVCGKVPTFTPQTLPDTHWPWHAAVYVRSLTGHRAADLQTDRVLTLPGQQGASEEATFWSLACSGALVSQRSVLVAAHCVVEQDKQLHPARVKVVMGMQHHTSQDQIKHLQHRRVSAILVHPQFHSGSGSDLAVLKLLDKARISERVLPVCLPEMRGDVTGHEAYAARWTVARDPEGPGRYTLSGRTKPVQIAGVAQCSQRSARREARPRMITDYNLLCVISKPSSPQDSCPAVMPGIAIKPSVTSSKTPTSSHTDKQEASGTVWELLGLESFTEQQDCHQKAYTGLTQIANFRDWIEENMK
ncbi:inactive serine protease PAMR1 [Polymixia lowei]